jgi:hypothetical protein
MVVFTYRPGKNLWKHQPDTGLGGPQRRFLRCKEESCPFCGTNTDSAVVQPLVCSLYQTKCSGNSATDGSNVSGESSDHEKT